MTELDNEWAKFLASMNNSNIVSSDVVSEPSEPKKAKASSTTSKEVL